jgi:signal peptidase II
MSARDFGLISAAIALALDQGTKLLLLYVFHFADPGPHEIQILPFFNLYMTWNPGVSYGLFPAKGPVGTAILVMFSLAAVVLLSYWLWNTKRLVSAVGFGVVIGGALGNVIDRLVYGKVADFFHFYVHDYSWYVFNVADCAITVGAAALIYNELLRSEPAADSVDGQTGAER